MAAVNAELVRLWSEQSEQPALWPMMHGEVAPDGFVSVGLNPSFSPDKTPGWSHLKKAPELAKLWESPRTHYAWNRDDHSNFLLETALLAEEAARVHHSFYAPLRQLHQSIQAAHPMGWHHLDIFALRKTDSRRLKGALFTHETRGKKALKLTPFGASQFMLFEKLLDLARPKIVVIFNALASRIYLQRRETHILADAGLGCYIDTVAGRSVPVLLSGFPKYMDEFSLKRLEWHLAHVLNQLSLKEGVGNS